MPGGITVSGHHGSGIYSSAYRRPCRRP